MSFLLLFFYDYYCYPFPQIYCVLQLFDLAAQLRSLRHLLRHMLRHLLRTVYRALLCAIIQIQPLSPWQLTETPLQQFHGNQVTWRVSLATFAATTTNFATFTLTMLLLPVTSSARLWRHQQDYDVISNIVHAVFHRKPYYPACIRACAYNVI